MTTVKPFTSLQKAFITDGEKYNRLFQEQIEHALGVRVLNASPKRHHYLVGGPGIGKTYAVNLIARKNKIDLVRIQGISSMNALTIQLATAAFLSQGKRINVWVDDCDSIFMDATSLSVMKGVFDADRNVLSWNKNMIAAISQYENSSNSNDKLIATALRNYQIRGGVGVEVPTDNMTFIVTTNRPLTPSNPMPKTARKMDESAIRDRVNYRDFDLGKNQSWGWLAATALKADLYKIGKANKHYLLDWMYQNWERLPSVSLRAVEDLAADMKNFADEYPDHWNARLIRAE